MLSRVAAVVEGLQSFFVWTLAFILTTVVSILIGSRMFWLVVFVTIAHPLYWAYWLASFVLYYLPAHYDSLRFKLIALGLQAMITLWLFSWLAYQVLNAK